MVRAPDEPGPLGVLIDGYSVGVFAPEAVAQVLASGLPSRGRRSFAIHSLLGHDAAATAGILAAAGLRRGYFWLHDFASVCASFHLLRNDVEDCGAPPPDSAACGICAYGAWRARHLEAHRTLFERLDLTVVAPSPVTLEFWRRSGDLPVRDAVVLPHATLTPRGRRRRRADGPFRVAYLGMPTALKGWPIFRDLARRFADDPRYAFVHLGGRPDPAAPAEFHPVTVTADRPDAMRDAMSALAVDAALIWPLCRETFSFTAYEAAAAGAAILTGPDSGNVAAFASEPGRGAVLADEAALEAAFETGAVLQLPRGATHDLSFSGLTADLVRPETR
jgi:glycosyltransferase involved in cell wall biosynthesis